MPARIFASLIRSFPKKRYAAFVFARPQVPRGRRAHLSESSSNHRRTIGAILDGDNSGA